MNTAIRKNDIQFILQRISARDKNGKLFCQVPDAGKVLVVTDPGLVKLGLAGRLTGYLDDAGIEYVLYSSVEQNPTSDNVEEGFRIFRENGCRSVVALGGGVYQPQIQHQR